MKHGQPELEPFSRNTRLEERRTDFRGCTHSRCGWIDGKLPPGQRRAGLWDTYHLRGGGTFTISPEGLVIADAAKQLDVALNDARIHVSAMRQQPTGTVKIACVPTAAHVLRPLVYQIADAYEGLYVDLISSISAFELAKGEADIAV